MRYLSSVKEYRGKEEKEREQLGERRVHCFFIFKALYMTGEISKMGYMTFFRLIFLVHKKGLDLA